MLGMHAVPCPEDQGSGICRNLSLIRGFDSIISHACSETGASISRRQWPLGQTLYRPVRCIL